MDSNNATSKMGGFKSRSVVPWMNDVLKTIEDFETSVNNKLKENGFNSIRLDESARIIKQQIKTAQNKFTMAFVGEFNSGKSTIINSLLGLREKESLSSEDRPDTALSTRIMFKEEGMDYDAEIIFVPGTYPNEQVDWETAKKYTSQIELDRNKSFSDKASKIDEVRYYIKDDFLSVCNILDLPGTGTGTHREHTDLTHKKIYEADVVFWVVSTSSEPDKNAIANLEKIRSKIIPIINVWQSSENGIKGELEPEQVLKYINERYNVYFNTEEKPIVYYAKEIEDALNNCREIDESWGKEQFADCLDRIVSSESIDLEREKECRILANINNALTKASSMIEDKRKELQEASETMEYEDKSNAALESSFYSIYHGMYSKIKDISKDVAKKVVDYLIDITDAFIEDEMQSGRVRHYISYIMRRKKDELEKEMREKYKNEYLRMEDKWYEAIMREFFDEIRTLLKGEYASFRIKIQEVYKETEGVSISSDFVSSIIEQSLNAVWEMIGKLVLAIISSVLLAVVPGGEIIDAIVVGLLGKKTIDTDRITRKKENIKARARLSIGIQRTSIFHKICDEGQAININCKDRIETIFKEKRSKSDMKKKLIDNAIREIQEFQDRIGDYISES